MPRVTTPARFWSLVDRSESCWVFKGRKDDKGYGRIGFMGRSNLGAHRISWMLTNGDVPIGNCVLHRCDNPPCCNPDHLFIGTNRDNVVDRQTKGRSKNLFTSRADHPAVLRSGQRHWRAKLTDIQVLEIRRLRSVGFTHSNIAEQFGVNPATISRIARGIWRQEAK